MAFKVKVNRVGWTDESGESHVYPRGTTLPSDVPAAQVRFWLGAGMVEKVTKDAA